MAWGKDCVDETQNDALRSKLRALGKILDRAQVGKDAAGRWMQRLAVTGADLKDLPCCTRVADNTLPRRASPNFITGNRETDLLGGEHSLQKTTLIPAAPCRGQRKPRRRILFQMEQKIAWTSAAEVVGISFELCIARRVTRMQPA